VQKYYNIQRFPFVAEYDKYGKLMSIPDASMVDYLNFLPFSAQPFTASQLQNRLESGENPRDLKVQLARSLVALYHGEEVANQAAERFRLQFTEQQVPEEIEELEIEGPLLVVDVLTLSQMAPSKTEARRLIEQGGVRIDGQVVGDIKAIIDAINPKVIQVGKRKFLRVIQKHA